MDIPITWNELFVEMVNLVAKRSKDPNTKVGAIAISPDKRNIKWGWNSFPIGIKDTEERWQRPKKYFYVSHAEEGLIINARESLEGWTLYLSIPPCANCCKLIMQAGIKKIIYLNEYNKNSQLDYSRDLLEEAGIEIKKWEE